MLPIWDQKMSRGTEEIDSAAAFARFVGKARFEELPLDVVDITKRAILDTLGVALASLRVWFTASRASSSPLRFWRTGLPASASPSRNVRTSIFGGTGSQT
jgi:hypothetical protein